jgi:intergrase/recombinase
MIKKKIDKKSKSKLKKFLENSREVSKFPKAERAFRVLYSSDKVLSTAHKVVDLRAAVANNL